MYYPDLSVYRIGRDEKGYTIFPMTKNVGWLSSERTFNIGLVQEKFLLNLKEILFMDTANANRLRNEKFPEILIEESYVRSPPINCPICNEKIIIDSDGLEYYTGSECKHVGNSALKIHVIDKGVYYSFPALLYHYVKDHNYLPPQEFIDAVINFDFGNPYNPSDYHALIKYKSISTDEIHTMDKMY